MHHNNIIIQNLQTLISHLDPTKPPTITPAYTGLKNPNHSDSKMIRFCCENLCWPQHCWIPKQGENNWNACTDIPHHVTCNKIQVNICSCSPFSHPTLRITQEAFNAMYCPGKSTVVLTHSASAFLHDSLLIPAVSPLLEVSLLALLLQILSHQPVCQSDSLTKPSAVILQLFSSY